MRKNIKTITKSTKCSSNMKDIMELYDMEEEGYCNSCDSHEKCISYSKALCKKEMFNETTI